MSKKKKVRVELRKNREKPPRENDLTRDFNSGDGRTDDAQSSERVRAKGNLSRYRTVTTDDAKDTMPAVSAEECIRGRVLRVHGLASIVETDDGRIFRCAVRRLLKSLATDERSVVTTGDVVWIRPARAEGGQPAAAKDEKQPDDEAGDSAQGPVPALEGMIERVEPR